MSNTEDSGVPHMGESPPSKHEAPEFKPQYRQGKNKRQRERISAQPGLHSESVKKKKKPKVF
jgi:hypothetical protein